MDDSSAAIVTAMAETVGERPWLLIVTRSRGTTGLRLPEEVAVEELELQPFDHAESVALLESWTVEEPVSRHLVRGDRAEGRRQPALHGGAARRGPRARDGRRPARLGGRGRHRRDRPAHPARPHGAALRLGPGGPVRVLVAPRAGERRGLEPGARRPAPARPVRPARGRQRGLVAVRQRGGPRRRVRRPAVPAPAADAPARRRRAGEDDRGPRRGRRAARHALRGGRRPRPRLAVRPEGGERSRAAYSYAEALDDYRAGRRRRRCRSTRCRRPRSPTCSRRPATSPTSPGFRARPSRRTAGRGSSPGPTPSSVAEPDGQGGGAPPADRSADDGAAHRRARARPGARGVPARLARCARS